MFNETDQNMKNGQFIGTTEQKTDEKNRIIIPVKWRDHLGSVCYMCSAPEGCIFIYTPEQWSRVTNQVADHAHNMAERARQRQFYIGATDANVDKQGRVTLSPFLMKRVGIEKEIVVNGSGNRIEIWPKDRFYEGPCNPNRGEGGVLDEAEYPEDVNW
ncbi:MAG: division/cell wall cluster transcriptional repressor MraZ [Clostridia bacterium]|nr:division/cell wall cluster transcriptional repressor MraZ [Clostridia bacterium]MBR5427995.1 division/cell wall cluster transcriptional repressor MraZ [Clostridia bacterium]